jgi:hypothetical protein
VWKQKSSLASEDQVVQGYVPLSIPFPGVGANGVWSKFRGLRRSSEQREAAIATQVLLLSHASHQPPYHGAQEIVNGEGFRQKPGFLDFRITDVRTGCNRDARGAVDNQWYMPGHNYPRTDAQTCLNSGAPAVQPARYAKSYASYAEMKSACWAHCGSRADTCFAYEMSKVQGAAGAGADWTCRIMTDPAGAEDAFLISHGYVFTNGGVGYNCDGAAATASWQLHLRPAWYPTVRFPSFADHCFASARALGLTNPWQRTGTRRAGGAMFFKLVALQVAYDDAKARCQAMGAELAHVKSEADFRAVARLMVDYRGDRYMDSGSRGGGAYPYARADVMRGAWLGASDAGAEGDWVWDAMRGEPDGADDKWLMKTSSSPPGPPTWRPAKFGCGANCPYPTADNTKACLLWRNGGYEDAACQEHNWFVCSRSQTQQDAAAVERYMR